MTEINPADYWLIRDAKNLIWGPVPRREVAEMLREHKLKPKTELSHSNSYWFGIEEQREVARFFPELRDALPAETEQEPTLATQGAVTKTVPGEWLSDEYAEEFGYVINETADGTTVAVPKSQATGTTLNAPAPQRMPEQEDEPTYVPHLVDSGTDPTIPVDETVQNFQRERDRRRRLFFFGLLAAATVLIFGFMLLERNLFGPKRLGDTPLQVGGGATSGSLESVVSNLRVGFLLNKDDSVQPHIRDLQARLRDGGNQDAKRLELTIGLAKAMQRKEFYMDASEAIKILTALRPVAAGMPREAAEVDNLLAIYQLDSSPEESVRLLREAAKAMPEDPVLQFNLALAYQAVNQGDKAVAILTGLLSQIGKDSRLLPRVLLALGRTGGKETEERLTAALEHDPYLSEAQLLLALNHWRTGHWSKAETLIQRFIDTLPGYRDSLYVKNFRVAEFPQIYNTARTELRVLMARVKPDHLLLSLDGMLSMLVGEYDEVEPTLDRALQVSAGSVHALKGMAFRRYGEGKDFEIETLLKSKVDQNQNSVAFNLLLAQSYAKQGKLAEARQLYAQLTQAEPKLSLGYSLQGDVALKMQQEEKALELYRKALKVDPYDVTALQGLSRLGRAEGVNELLLQSLLPF